MSKSPLSPQARTALYIAIGLAIIIGLVIMVMSVGQQLSTFIERGQTTQTGVSVVATNSDFENGSPTPRQPQPSPTERAVELNDPTPTVEPSNTASSVRPSPTMAIVPEVTPPLQPIQIPTQNATPDNVMQITTSQATNVEIVDQSGAVVGVGVLRVYYADTVSAQNTTRVELELRFIEKFVTATPSSPITAIPVTPATSTPQPMRPTATPRISQHEETGVLVQQLMGASLFCSPDSFSGCDTIADPADFILISEGGAFWSWTLRPQVITGVHDLRLELWTLVSINGQTRTNTLWQYPFSITVTDIPTPPPSSEPDNSLLIVLVGVIGISAMILIFYIQRKTSQSAPKHINSNKPTVFLSYRRKVSWAVALKLHESLTEKGADVFMDMEDLGEGQFAQKLVDEIQKRDYFVLLLAPDTLKSEWVMREAQLAMKAGKRIIPVLTDGFTLAEENLPTELKGISSHNAVTITLEFYDAGINRIAKFIGL